MKSTMNTLSPLVRPGWFIVAHQNKKADRRFGVLMDTGDPPREWFKNGWSRRNQPRSSPLVRVIKADQRPEPSNR
jgi:hypothetical protein